MKTYTFHVNGMHCKSCTVLIESELKEIPGITRVKADLRHHIAEVTGDFGEALPEQVAAELSMPLKAHGYSLSVEKKERTARWGDFKIALPLALGFGTLFIVLQKLGIVNLITSGEVTYGTAFMIGLIASVSTCMAVVGGLVLSMSANFAKEGDKVRPQLFFHAGRLVSFFVLGGAVGALGSAFQLSGTATFALSLVVAVVLLVLGVKLLDIFPWAARLQPTLPRFISGHLLEIRKVNHTLTPFAVGVATFFLPCGFTQSMQLYTLSTGDFWTGAMTMFVFALGTLPMLAVLSFTSLGIHGKATSGIFYKTAGLVVIFFALYNLLNSLVVLGLLPPLFNF